VSKYLILCCGSGIFLTLDPGWKNSNLGFGKKHPGSATLDASLFAELFAAKISLFPLPEVL
jgi:hypothetical protein